MNFCYFFSSSRPHLELNMNEREHKITISVCCHPICYEWRMCFSCCPRFSKWGFQMSVRWMPSNESRITENEKSNARRMCRTSEKLRQQAKKKGRRGKSQSCMYELEYFAMSAFVRRLLFGNIMACNNSNDLQQLSRFQHHQRHTPKSYTNAVYSLINYVMILNQLSLALFPSLSPGWFSVEAAENYWYKWHLPNRKETRTRAKRKTFIHETSSHMTRTKHSHSDSTFITVWTWEH